ncbi:MAG: hypothetical protein IKT46_09040 [Clostridia bacterium]|nr:hypothetical protein [Clostridia bacterium]
MSKKNHNNNISPEELLAQLKSSIELDDIELPEEIDIPAAPTATQMSAEERFKARRNGAYKSEPEAEAAEESAVESEPEVAPEVAEEPAEEINLSTTREVPTVGEEPQPVRITTQEFSKIEAEAMPEEKITSEFDAVANESPEVDIDALMKKYLTEAEYEEVLRTRREAEDPDLALHISEAEEYVSSIENEIEKNAPIAPVTETQKVIKEMDIPHTSEDGTLDETDINLMIAFGMNEELEEKLGDENAQVIEEAVRKDAENFAQIKHEDNIPDEIDANMEFTHSSQIKEVFEIYKKQHRNLLIKIFIAVGALIAVLLFENIGALGVKYPGILDPQVYPVIHIMASLQLLTLSCILVIRPILRGFKGLFTGKPTADSILSSALLVSVIYHIAACFLYDGSAMLLCNTPIVLCILLSLISRMFTLKRDIFSFNIVSSKRVKYTVSRMEESDTVMEHEAFDEFIDEDCSVFRVTKTNFVDNFFKRTRSYGKNKAVLSALIPICLVLVVFFVLFVGLFRGDWFMGIRCGYLLMALAVPATAFITYSYPLYRASKVAFDMGSAIVGEDSLEEYSNAGAVSFDDKDVFPSQKTKVKSIKIYGNNRIDKVIYNVASLFKVIGGPLNDVFNIATKEFDCSDDVEIVDIAEDGIEAVISGKHIFYGKASYLHKNNFEPVFEADDERIEFSGEACIAYLVCNDEVAAKLYISYGIDPDFIAISKQLYRAGMCIGIKSFDPNIDDALLGKHINMSKYAVKVLKCRFLSEKTSTEERSDSGIVSKKNPKSLLKTLALCDKVNSVTRGALVIKILSILLAFGITVFIMFVGASSFNLAGVYTAVYQLFWMIPVMGISLINIKK